MRWRPVLSLGVIAALGVAVWAALSAGSDEPSPTTSTAVPVTTSFTTSTTTPTTVSTTSTTVPAATTSVTETTTDPEARLEEVRLILEDLYYRWFDAIYRNDEAAVREVVATEQALSDFRSAVENLDLPREPTRKEIRISDLEILRDDTQCLVTYSTLDLTAWRGEGVETSGVDVLLRVDASWRLGTTWTNPSDLWEPDCLIEPEV